MGWWQWRWFSCSVVSNSFATPWPVACQAPLSMGFPRQEYWSGVPFPSLGDLPDPGIEPVSPALQAASCIAGGFFTTEQPGKPQIKGRGLKAPLCQFRTALEVSPPPLQVVLLTALFSKAPACNPPQSLFPGEPVPTHHAHRQPHQLISNQDAVVVVPTFIPTSNA